MSINVRDWQIRRYPDGRCWEVRHRIGNNGRYKGVFFHQNLANACTELFEHLARHEVDAHTLNLPDASSARECTAVIVDALERLAHEIQEAINER